MTSSGMTSAGQGAAAKLGQAIDLFQRGYLDAAAGLCDDIVRRNPADPDALHVLGIIALQRSQPALGAELIQRSLKINPLQPTVLCSLGNALRDLGRPLEALANYQRAIELAPEFAGAHYSAGNALSDVGRFEEAAASFDRAIALQPGYAHAYQNRGNALLSLGKQEQALESYQKALLHDPGLTVAMSNCAKLLRQLNRLSEALPIYDRLLALQADDEEALIGRGTLLAELHHEKAAIETFDRALARFPASVPARYGRATAYLATKSYLPALSDYDALIAARPDIAEAHCNRGYCLLGLDRAAEAEQSFEHASTLDPRLAEAVDGRGIALQSQRKLTQALAAFEQALALRPEAVDIEYRRAVTLRQLQRHEESARSFARVVRLAPDYDYAIGNLLHERIQTCDWTEYSPTLSRIDSAVAAGKPAYLPGPYFSVSDSAQLQLLCARTFVADKRLESLRPVVSPWKRGAGRRERLVVAYVSADFREHPVSYLLAGLLEAHDRSRFQIVGVSIGPADDSAIGKRVRGSFDHVIDGTRCSDAEVATLMRELDVDIAVDLMGFSGGARPPIFAHGAAPVQVNYLGFAGTLGTSYHDYIVADREVIPETHRIHYSEKVVYLPHCFQPNDVKRAIPATAARADHGLPPSGFVFCCFNTPYKISPAVFDVWMRLLHQVEGSVLWLPDGGEATIRNLRSEAAARGVGTDRIVFAPRMPDMADHLARYRVADLFLDTLPYNAHTTGSDALWAGLPLLTCRGNSFASRVAASLLRTLDCPQLITGNLRDYETKARELALTPGLLSEIRARLERNRTTSPLFDTQRYCWDLETAYVMMRERWAQGAEPDHLAI